MAWSHIFPLSWLPATQLLFLLFIFLSALDFALWAHNLPFNPCLCSHYNKCVRNLHIWPWVLSPTSWFNVNCCPVLVPESIMFHERLSIVPNWKRYYNFRGSSNEEKRMWTTHETNHGSTFRNCPLLRCVTNSLISISSSTLPCYPRKTCVSRSWILICLSPSVLKQLSHRPLQPCFCFCVIPMLPESNKWPSGI